MADAEGAPGLDPRLRRTRAAAQLLHPRQRREPVEIVRHLLAVQAQDFRAAPLALRARGKGFKRADVHAALDRAEIVIGWLNRGTLHLVCREDYAWLHALTAPTLATANRRRLEQEGVSATATAKGVRAIERALADGPLLRRELREVVRSAGVRTEGQAMVHILFAASLEGLIVRGPVRGKEQSFVLCADHLGALPKVDREAAVRELGIRYTAGHAPADAADLAWWSGLPLRDTRVALASSKTPGSVSKRAPRRIPPRLLPAFDAYMLGWKSREFSVPPDYGPKVIGGGMFRPVIVIDGRVAGGWRLRDGRAELEPFEDLSDDDRQALEVDADDVAAFA